MKKIIGICTASAALAVMLTSCGTPPQRLDPAGNQGIISTDKIDFKDFQIAAEKGINSLLTSGALNRADGRKTVIMVSEVRNNSSMRTLNTQILTDKIRQAILRSGKAMATSAVGQGKDNAVKQVRDLENSEMFNQNTVQKQGTVIAPDMSLSGEITQEMRKSGRTEESYFFIHMVVTDLSNGLAVWEDNVEILKQGKKSIFD